VQVRPIRLRLFETVSPGAQGPSGEEAVADVLPPGAPGPPGAPPAARPHRGRGEKGNASKEAGELDIRSLMQHCNRVRADLYEPASRDFANLSREYSLCGQLSPAPRSPAWRRATPCWRAGRAHSKADQETSVIIAFTIR
jgi:hypothetical protein